MHEPHGEWADQCGSDDRQHIDVGVGSSQYFTWVKYLQAYIQRQPPPASGYYPDSEIVIFIDNGNSYCYAPGAASIKKNVEALHNIMVLFKHWKMSCTLWAILILRVWVGGIGLLGSATR